VGLVPRSKLALLVLCTAAIASTATAAVVRTGNLQITVLGQLLPFKLPRDRPAPVAVFISGHVDSLEAAEGSLPPQLQRMIVRVNHHGQLRPRGIPTCTVEQIQPGTTGRALANCGDALVGSGRFWASVLLPDQRPYRTRGRLLVFNGRRGGSPVLFAHIYTSQPFNTSFVVTFGIERIDEGPFGTQLTADFPRALGSWGFVDRIKLTLRRKFSRGGRERSYFNASCPAPKETGFTTFTLARASFFFAERKPISLDVVKSCGVKE
jgi:hypothetical protein